MKIIFPLNDFLFELFPEGKGDNEQLQKLLKAYYSNGSFNVEVEVGEGFVAIELTGNTVNNKAAYQELVGLSERGEFEKAKDLATDLIAKYPNVSEFHRILGQIHSEEGNQTKAIDCLIDSLKWNPKNAYALLMMGNIFAREKGDVETAMTYYQQVLREHSNDYISLNVVGSNLMQVGKVDEAIGYLQRAADSNPKYPNTYYTIALAFELKKDYLSAFNYALIAIKVNPKKDGLYNQSHELALEFATKAMQNGDVTGVIDEFSSLLETACSKKIMVEVDEQILTAAKIEFAENYDKDYHLVKYKSNYPAVEHLLIHEMMHLKLVTEARNEGVNELFTSTGKNKTTFFNDLDAFAKMLRDNGVPDTSVTNYLTALFGGINSQMYNTPIDLFIEDRIYENYPELKVYQFLSLYRLLQEGIEATTKPEIIKQSPSNILSVSKILNLINALHFKELFALDLISDFKPSKSELKLANDLYAEFEEYRNDKAAGEEYELIQHWAEDLKLSNYFELVPEDKHRQKNVDDVLDEMVSDPYSFNTQDSAQERKMKKFLNSYSDKDVNPAVAFHMMAAIEYFNEMEKSNVKTIAFEFATLGLAGIAPEKSGYSIPSMKGRSFTGYQALAYYYVSFALAVPNMLTELQMPFDKEYRLAMTFFRAG
tara:strand:+ start:9793 stop:11754 length:1962 start_codon:yes stop_codon:yes gene_type:complete